MNPNSRNQWWSLWTITVTPGVRKMRPFVEVKTNIARFMRKAFGSASQCRIQHDRKTGAYTIQVRTEGHPAHDPTYVAYYAQHCQRFFVAGFGVGTQVKTDAKLEAGSRQDGTPSEQLIILPSITFSLQGV